MVKQIPTHFKRNRADDDGMVKQIPTYDEICDESMQTKQLMEHEIQIRDKIGPISLKLKLQTMAICDLVP